MKKLMMWLLICVMAATAQAAVYTWDGGAATSSFGDAANWDPDGTTYTSVDEYQITDGSSVTAGSDFSISGFDLSGASSLTVASGQTLTVNGNNITALTDGTLNILGTMDVGNNKWSITGAGGTVTINVDGLLTSGVANFSVDAQVILDMQVNGTFNSKVAQMGAVTAVDQIISVNSGGVFNVAQTVSLRYGASSAAAIYLNGGTMNFSGTETFDYANLALTGDDGIIFTDSSSSVVLEGDRTADVNTWISDGALSSQIGPISVVYNAGDNETVVTAYGVVDGPFSWDGGAGTANFGDASNWDPDGTAFRTVDAYGITSGSNVVTDGQSFDVASIQISGGSELTVSSGDTLSLNDNLQSYWKNDGTLNVDGVVDFGTLRVDNNTGVSVLNVSSSGSLVMNGNNVIASAGGSSFTANLSGSVSMKVAQGGSSVVASSFAAYINSGATLDVTHSWILRSVAGGRAAVYLNGGTIELGATGGVGNGPESFIYTDLTFDGGDDGLIFTDTASQILLAGNRTNDMNTWISDGFLSSQVGELTISYNSSEDTTVVQPFTLPTEIGDISSEMMSEGLLMSWDGAADVTYVVESTDDLVNGTWSNAYSAIGSGGTLSVTGSVGQAQEFYRVRIEE